jgi:hypothetical protein
MQLCLLRVSMFHAVDGPRVVQPYRLTPLDVFERFILQDIFRKAQDKNMCCLMYSASI